LPTNFVWQFTYLDEIEKWQDGAKVSHSLNAKTETGEDGITFNKETNRAITGLWIYHYSDKWWDETPYKDGKKHGREKSYLSSKLTAETPYKDGQRHGLRKAYYKSGKLSHEEPYKNGKWHGARKIYNEEGLIIGTDLYKDGELVEE